MLSKAVLSFVGRAVGIAGVLALSHVARAAQPAPEEKVVARSPSAHHAKAHKKAAKRAPHRGDAVAAPAAAAPKDPPEVTIERASTKRAPKPSPTPLPTVAAAATKPLAEPIGMKGTLDVRRDAGHAPEPSRTPIVVSTREPHKAKHAKPPCLHAPVAVMRGTEEEAFPLTKCDGSVAPLAVDTLSILVRPGSAAKPKDAIADLAKKAGDELAPGIKRIDPRLVERLQLVFDHFSKGAKAPTMYVVSGYRPASKGSFHATGRAVDFRLEGVDNTDLVAFCKTLPDTGCGFYPNSSFIHLDVRDEGTGHVSWIDASSPGEKPQYVATWPPPPSTDDDDTDPVKLLAKLDELQILPPTGHEPEADAKPSKKENAPAAVLGKKIELDVDEK